MYTIGVWVPVMRLTAQHSKVSFLGPSNERNKKMNSDNKHK